MTFFWTYFRYQTVFGVLYPLDATVPFLGVPIQIYVVFLAVLLILSLGVLLFSRGFEDLLSLHRPLVFLLNVFGSIGVVICLLIERGLLGTSLIWLSAGFVAVGFLMGCLAWALYFSRFFGSREIVMLATSYLISLVLFTAMGIYLSGMKDYVLMITPACVGLFWLLAGTPRVSAEKSGLGSLRKVGPYVGLFVAFLLTGSVVRGIVDLEDPIGHTSYLRWILSIIVSVAILVACVLYHKKSLFFRTDQAQASGDEYSETERMTLKCWIVLAIMFFAGIFMCLIFGTYAVGGNIVVVARSSLDFFLWVLLCNLVYHKKVALVPLFIVYNILVWIISSFLSYVVIPLLPVVDNGTGMSTFDILVLTVIFTLVALIIVIFGTITLHKRPSESTALIEHVGNPVPSVPEEQVREYRLTNREVEVINLFSQGYTLNMVATKLYISKGTAQTHVKSIYRKLGVHSKDDFIEMVGGWIHDSESNQEASEHIMDSE